MGSYDGAELCELVGIYILHELSKRYGLEISGLYRDDGLQCNKSARIIERMKKDIIKLFKEKVQPQNHNQKESQDCQFPRSYL